MRRVDSSLGRVGCALLTAARRVRDRRTASARPHRLERILIIKLAEQGATVVAYPALKRAADLVGSDNLFILVFAENKAIVEELRVLPEQNILAIRSNALAPFAWDVLRAIWRLRRLGIDAAVDFESFARLTAILAYLSGARIRVGLHSFAGEGPWRGNLMTHPIAANPHLHASVGFEILVEALTVEASRLPALDLPLSDVRPVTPPPRFEPTSTEIERVSDLVRDRLPGADPPRLVLLNANAGDLVPLRRWPSERYVEVARRVLDSHPDTAVVFTGSRSEAAQAELLVDAVGSARCVSLAGRTTLRELLVLFTLASVLVTNDSGPAHFAAMTPLRVVTLFGPESPAVFGSRSARSRELFAAVPCSPCLNAFNNRQSACTNNICMQRIGVDVVVAAVEDALGR